LIFIGFGFSSSVFHWELIRVNEVMEIRHPFRFIGSEDFEPFFGARAHEGSE